MEFLDQVATLAAWVFGGIVTGLALCLALVMLRVIGPPLGTVTARIEAIGLFCFVLLLVVVFPSALEVDR